MIFSLDRVGWLKTFVNSFLFNFISRRPDMKKIVITLATLSLLTLAACGNSGGSSSGKQAITARKIDKSTAVPKEAPAAISAKEGENPAAAKKKD
jgi:hypothetical protein